MKRLAIQFSLLSPYIFVCCFMVLSALTPNYNHFSHTISRLSLGTYGFMESLNIMQFSAGIMMMIYLVRHHIHNSRTTKEISFMLGAVALVLALLAIFPTDPIDTFPRDILTITWNGVIHFVLVIGFVFYAPIAIWRLYCAFLMDLQYRDLALVTLVCGALSFVLSLIWFIFFFIGFLNDYRGLLQKIIALITLYWITVIMKRTASIAIKEKN